MKNSFRQFAILVFQMVFLLRPTTNHSNIVNAGIDEIRLSRVYVLRGEKYNYNSLFTRFVNYTSKC